jgi:hypothetical protein
MRTIKLEFETKKAGCMPDYKMQQGDSKKKQIDYLYIMYDRLALVFMPEICLARCVI